MQSATLSDTGPRLTPREPSRSSGSWLPVPPCAMGSGYRPPSPHLRQPEAGRAHGRGVPATRHGGGRAAGPRLPAAAPDPRAAAPPQRAGALPQARWAPRGRAAAEPSGTAAGGCGRGLEAFRRRLRAVCRCAMLVLCRQTTRVPDPGARKGEGRAASRGRVPEPHGRGQRGRHVRLAGCGGTRPHNGSAAQGRRVPNNYVCLHCIINTVSKLCTGLFYMYLHICVCAT